MKSKIISFLKDEEGQSLVEYAFLALAMTIAVAGLSRLFSVALKAYYDRISFIVSLPIP